MSRYGITAERTSLSQSYCQESELRIVINKYHDNGSDEQVDNFFWLLLENFGGQQGVIFTRKRYSGR